MNKTPHQAFNQLQNQLQAGEALLIEDPVDLFYLLQKPISLGSLLISKQSIDLFVDGRYFSAFLQLPNIKTHPSEKEGFSKFVKSSQLKTVFFDGDKTSFEKANSFEKMKPVLFESKRQLLKDLRLIKSAKEIDLIRASAHLLASVYQEFLTLPKIGLSEKEISRQFQKLSYEKGADGFSFEPIIAITENAAFPHHRPQNRILKEGDAMLVDIGVRKDDYQSDMTRMVFFGHVPNELLKFHDIVLEAHAAALKCCQPGVKLGLLDQAARDVFKRYDVESYFVHSLGHGLGLETHEAPRIKFDGPDKDLILKEGMVITIEPGLYKEGLGGIRHEDLIVITKTGYENFYPNYL